MKPETLDEKILWLRRIKSMILIIKKEIDDVAIVKNEIFTNAYPNFEKAYDMSNDFDQIVTEENSLKKELIEWKKLYFRDLSNI